MDAVVIGNEDAHVRRRMMEDRSSKRAGLGVNAYSL
jgi:hypothetical protein